MLIPGVLYLNSSTIYGFTKNKVPIRKFKSYLYGYDNKIIYVSTKKKTSAHNLYAIVREQDINNTKKYILISIIGKVGDYQVEKKFAKYMYKLNRKPVRLQQLPNIDITPDRTIITQLNCYSIDPSDCTDIDDLVSYNIINKNICRIGIHIADVSSYIAEGSDLDNIIRNRGETIYYDNYKDNMLPDIMADNICSLIENVEKRAYSIFFDIDINTYQILKQYHTKSIVINKNRLTYEEAEKIIISNNNKYTDLIEMYNIGEKLYAKDNYDIHKMIETFMILANSYVGNFIKDKQNAIIRVQDAPLPDTMSENNLGYVIKDNVYNVISMFSRERAYYKFVCSDISLQNNDNLHYDLGIKNYTHFTSPIRRYADILVHRTLYNVTKNDPNICNHLNDVHKKISYLCRDLDRLNFVYTIQNLDTIQKAYVIHINDNEIKVYIKDANIDGICKLFSKKISHLINYKSDCEKIIIDDNIFLKLADEIKIRLIVSTKAPTIKKKLLIQLIEPNIKHITYKKNL